MIKLTTVPNIATRMLWGCEALQFEKKLVRQSILEGKRPSDNKNEVFTRVKAYRVENKRVLLAPGGRFRTMDRRWNWTEKQTALLMISTIW